MTDFRPHRASNSGLSQEIAVDETEGRARAGKREKMPSDLWKLTELLRVQVGHLLVTLGSNWEDTGS